VRFLSYRHNGLPSFGLQSGTGIIDLPKRLDGSTLKALIADGGLARAARFIDTPPDFAIGDVHLLPVMPDPGNIICIGLNYEEHRAETVRPKAEHPAIFLRVTESLQAAGAPLLIPLESEQFDYEGELALIVGRAGRRIAESEAWSYVAGVTCFNDATVRDWQYHTHQFGPGKNFPFTGAMGPALVTVDELPEDKVMTLQTRLNGKVMQSSDTSQMIFPVPRLLAYISSFMTLQPGDVVVTGTPGGVGARRQPPVWMKSGDVVEVEIGHVGLLRNACSKEQRPQEV